MILAAYVLVDFGEAAVQRGDFAAAFERCERALAIFTSGKPDNHPDDGLALACRGRARFELGKLAEARADLERALGLGGATNAPLRRGELRFALARTLGALGTEPDRRRELAAAARQDFADADAEARASATDQWLAAGAR